LFGIPTELTRSGWGGTLESRSKAGFPEEGVNFYLIKNG
jgi:hypothetical protein